MILWYFVNDLCERYCPVQLGMHFFPRCSKVIDRFLGDDLSGLSIVEHINTDERKNRYNEILEEMNEAFTQDKNEKAFGRSAASSSAASSSKSARAARNKVAKK